MRAACLADTRILGRGLDSASLTGRDRNRFRPARATRYDAAMKRGRTVGAPRGEEGRPQHGRGAVSNPTGRYESRVRETDPEQVDEPREIRPETVLINDKSRSIVSTNDSPDIGFDASVNPYRGCEHGCAYCYALPTHEYLGYSAGLDFE